MPNQRAIELVEGRPKSLSAAELAPDLAQEIWQRYAAQVEIESPTFKTGHQWQLTAKSWAGFLPTSSPLVLHLLPKFPHANLYRMLDYVYGLSMNGDIINADRFTTFVESLAKRLCTGIALLLHRGIYRTYVPRIEQRTFVRGRLDMYQLASRPNPTRLLCHSRHLTADIMANQILLWTLHVLLHSRLCRHAVQQEIRHTYHDLRGIVSLRPCTPRECTKQSYHRLNLEYRELHALCRFFLENVGPLHTTGAHIAPAFLVATDQLFERFVAAWMRRWLPSTCHLAIQERLPLATGAGMHFQIDLVLNQPGECWVIDTKYKRHTPDSGDVAQIIAYAQVKQAQQAILVYPEHAKPGVAPLDFHTNGIRVRSVAFPLDGDLDLNGQQFFTSLGLSRVHEVH